MVKGEHKNLTNRNQEYWASSEPSMPPTTTSPGYLNTSEKQDEDLKSYLMMVVEDFKKGINNSLKEIQNTAKQVEALKEEAQKFLKELQDNAAKQVEAIKEETQKPLKELQENTDKQVEVFKELQANTAKQVEERKIPLKN
jgi:predicted transcriptional regulator